MDKKKYFLLLPPFATLAFFLAYTLPSDKKYFSMFAVLAFWITYYGWIYIEKKKQNP